MLKFLQFVLDAVVDTVAGSTIHLMGGSSHAVGSDDKSEDSQKSDDLHD